MSSLPPPPDTHMATIHHLAGFFFLKLFILPILFVSPFLTSLPLCSSSFRSLPTHLCDPSGCCLQPHLHAQTGIWEMLPSAQDGLWGRWRSRFSVSTSSGRDEVWSGGLPGLLARLPCRPPASPLLLPDRGCLRWTLYPVHSARGLLSMPWNRASNSPPHYGGIKQ